MKNRILAALLVALLGVMPMAAGPQDWNIRAHVTYVDVATGLDGFRFQTDASAPPCTGGTAWFLFDARFETNSSTPQADRREIIKRAWAGVLAAKLSGQTLAIFGDSTPDSSGNCVVGYMGPN